MIKYLTFASLFSFSFCSIPWKGYGNVKKYNYKHGVIVIRETPLYEHPIEDKKYQIGFCKEGTLFDVDSDYTNNELSSRDDIARSYYKVTCDNRTGFLPILSTYTYENVLEAKTAKELSAVDWKSFKTLSIFQEQISGERYLTESDLSFVIYSDFDYLKSARVWLDISNNSNTIYKEPYQIIKTNSDNTEFTLISKRNETITISRINNKYSKVSGFPLLNGGKETIVQRYNIIKDWNSYESPWFRFIPFLN
ncbi:hypothetical protein [Leptospira brenneri]|uniref:hypothetical protein n=1 Tax=Leptospira brenneri TaxID=2023182 RepID=UPI000C2A0D8E|nr:hypothetical protein [Leptospira brenneri]PJZ43726.1 hypothetical protein CH361_18955 [Leptospira brenneri]